MKLKYRFLFTLGFLAFFIFSCEVSTSTSVSSPKIVGEIEGAYYASKVVIKQKGSADKTLSYSGKSDSQVKINIEKAAALYATNAFVSVIINGITSGSRGIDISKTSNEYTGVSTQSQDGFDKTIYNVYISGAVLTLTVSGETDSVIYTANK